jgi:hypothetical protein
VQLVDLVERFVGGGAAAVAYPDACTEPDTRRIAMQDDFNSLVWAEQH